MIGLRQRLCLLTVLVIMATASCADPELDRLNGQAEEARAAMIKAYISPDPGSGIQQYLSNEQVNCTTFWGAFGEHHFVTDAQSCVENKHFTGMEPVDKAAHDQRQMAEFNRNAVALQNQQRAAVAAQQAEAARNAAAQRAIVEQQEAARNAASARKAERKQREAEISQQNRVNYQPTGLNRQLQSRPKGTAGESVLGSSADRDAAVSELNSLFPMSASYPLPNGSIKYSARLFQLSTDGIDYADGNESPQDDGNQHWFHYSTTWNHLNATSVTVTPGQQGSMLSLEGYSNWTVVIAGTSGSVSAVSPLGQQSQSDGVLITVFTQDDSLPNKIADLFRKIAIKPSQLAAQSQENSGGVITVTVDSNALGGDNGANYVHFVNTGNKAVTFSAWTDNCSNLEIAMCGNQISNARLYPGAEAGFWINRDDDSQAWGYSVGCSVAGGGSSECNASGGGGPAPPT